MNSLFRLVIKTTTLIIRNRSMAENLPADNNISEKQWLT